MEIVLAELEYGEVGYSEHVKDEFKEKLKIKLKSLIFIISQKCKEIDYNGDDVSWRWILRWILWNGSWFIKFEKQRNKVLCSPD